MGENNKIYIPTNIQTEQMIFQGFGTKELFKSIGFTLVMSVIWFIVYLFTKNSMYLVFEILISAVVGVFLYVKDPTNQNVVNYMNYMLNFATSQRKYRYNNRIEEEERYIVRKYKETVVSEQK